MVRVIIKGLQRKFDDGTSVGPINLTAEAGELLTLLGPSGSGKTTTLSMIAGFLRPDRGCLLFNKRDVTSTPSRERNIGMVVQSVALFPNMSVFQNISFALDVAGWNREDTIERVNELANMLGIKPLLERRIDQISGGEGQRIALARALARKPQLLLLDEPLSALDPQLRARLQSEIRKIQQDLGITTIYVTHNQDEAFAISDKIAILNEGVVHQVGTPDELYKSPNSEFVANFIDEGNILRGICRSNIDGYIMVQLGESLIKMKGEGEMGEEVIFTIKPEHIQLNPNSLENSVETHLVSIVPLVGENKLTLTVEGQTITCRTRHTQTSEELMNVAVIRIGLATENVRLL
ncbi:MAG: ABC transporter ATP-binding protein [Candidatus Thorarchaeota archaeon]